MSPTSSRFRLPPIRTKPATTPNDFLDEIEPMTPAGRLFSDPIFNCYILVTIGFTHPIDLEAIKSELQNTLLKHKRFRSVVKKHKSGKLSWVPVQVKIDDHLVIPDVQHDQCNFVEDYVAKLANSPPLDPARPLWEIHVLNAKLKESMANLVLRVHHSLGDGVSLMSLFLSCTRRVDEPESLPTIPSQTKQTVKRASQRDVSGKFGSSFIGYMWIFFQLVWRLLLVLCYTCSDVYRFLATSLWMDDSNTPIKGSPGVEFQPRVLAYSTFSLEDIAVVKRAVNGTVNDVMVGLLFAAMTRYLQHRYVEDALKEKQKYEEEKSNVKITEGEYASKVVGNSKKPHLKAWAQLQVRASALVNTRPSPGLQELHAMMVKGSQARWGNHMGYLLLPVFIGECKDALEYARRAKTICDRNKLSLVGPFTYASGALLMNLAGAKVASKMTYRCTSHATLSLSNVSGPLEQVQLAGNPITHIIPTVCGQPQSLCIHFQSYMGKMTVVAFAARDLIPDPERLCQFVVSALQEMNQSAKSTVVNS